MLKMNEINKRALILHEKHHGTLGIRAKVKVKTKDDLSLVYTPGVAEPCRKIYEDKENAYKYTLKHNSVAVVSDGSAVLGMGNIGALASIPVMQGKSLLFKEFADIDAFPICVETQDPDEIVQLVKNIAPAFGGINLEDIAAPKCFEIAERLQDIGIPVMHDDQHGTEVVTVAALKNACKVTGKKLQDIKVVILGAGAAGIAVAKALLCSDASKKICDPVSELIMCDSNGIISKDRDDLNKYKKEIAELTNPEPGSLSDALVGADVFIGVSKAKLVTKEMVRSMKDPIVFAMANPIPEIMPEDAKEAGALVVATGRSDFPNQVNNVLAFPGIFKGALEAKATKITPEMRIAASNALASAVTPSKYKILPSPLDKNVVKIIAEAVKNQAIESGVVRN